MSRNEQMVLTAMLLPAGYTRDGWRLPGSGIERVGSFDLIRDQALTCERAKLDAIFLADIPSAKTTVLSGDVTAAPFYEPVTTLAALAIATDRIGLIGTLSTTYTEPFTVARQLASIDWLSGGRAGWNIVTSWAGNENYGIATLPSSADRYRRAAEFVEVTKKLWQSWDVDAIVADRERGTFADFDKIHAVDHSGEFFTVAGPLTVPRSPQGRPLLVQAGSSPEGMELGSGVADAIYTAQADVTAARNFYSTFKELVRGKGRTADSVAILPGIIPIVARTDSDAREIENHLAELMDFDSARAVFASALSLNLSDLGLDERIPEDRFTGESNLTSRYELFKHKALDEGKTLRELIVENQRAFGHQWIAGSASTVADRMIDWFDQRACDGFSLNAPYIPQGLSNICELLVPELQSRGVFRADYTDQTLRGRLHAATQTRERAMI